MTGQPVPILIGETHLARYLKATRAPSYSLLFLLPLLVAYEGLALLINVHHTIEVRNGADVILQEFLRVLNVDNLPLAIVLVTIVIVGALATHMRVGTRLEPQYFPAMFLESCVWALVLGSVSRRLVGIFLSSPSVPITDGLWTKIMLYLGAGVYEELVFRVLLVSLFLYALRHSVGLGSTCASLLAMIFASLLFSGFHHVGVLGEPFEVPVFMFRFFAGLVLSALYVTRGFGITAWAHSLYDLFHLVGWT